MFDLTFPARAKNVCASTEIVASHSRPMLRVVENIVTRLAARRPRESDGESSKKRRKQRDKELCSPELRDICAAPDCEKPLPAGSTKRRKYCSVRCRVTAWRRRRS